MSRSLAVAAACLWLGGCANLGYYAQAIEGQADILSAARPIPQLVAAPDTDAALRRQLEQVEAIRQFASHDLALPDNGSYRSYARLSRPYVVWNVFAAPALSVEPKQWCLLFIGCVNYRGYFDERAAERFADGLQRRGFDTYVAGVPAYSTLGYFDDPVLDTFLRFGDDAAASIIFHELAHQRIYVRGDTAFNESFAVTVADEGMRRWLARTGSEDRLRQFEAQRARAAEVDRLFARCREHLRGIYGSSLTEEQKLHAKAVAFADLRRALSELKPEPKADAGRSARPMNNARLASMALYTRWLPSFRALLAQEHGSLPDFYRRVAELAKRPEPDRTKVLTDLAAGSAPSRQADRPPSANAMSVSLQASRAASH